MSRDEAAEAPARNDYILDQLLPAGPIRIYGVLSVFAAVVASLWLAATGWKPLAWVLPPIVAITGLTGKLRFAGPVFLFLMLGALGETRRYAFQAPIGASIELMTWALGLITMGFLITHYRFSTFKSSVFPDHQRLTPPWQRGPARKEEADPPRRVPATFHPPEFWDIIIGSLASLMLAQVVLHFLPREIELELFSEFQPQAVRGMMLAWGGGALVLAGFGFFAYRRWVQLSPREAGVYLRSVAWRWNAKEHEALERYRARRS